MASASKLPKSVQALGRFLRAVREDLSGFSLGDLENALSAVKLDLEAKDETFVAMLHTQWAVGSQAAFIGTNRLPWLFVCAKAYPKLPNSLAQDVLKLMNKILWSFRRPKLDLASAWDRNPTFCGLPCFQKSFTALQELSVTRFNLSSSDY